MTRKELLYLLILLPERAKSKGDLSGADDDMHTPHTEPTERAAARRAHLMGVTRKFRHSALLVVEISRGTYPKDGLCCQQVKLDVMFYSSVNFHGLVLCSSARSQVPTVPLAGGVKGQSSSLASAAESEVCC